MGWPPDFQATLTHHSISCSSTDSPQAVLVLAWRSPKPSKSIEDAAQLTVLRDLLSLQQLQPEHRIDRQAD